MKINEVNCLFCKIGSQEIPSEIVYESDDAVAFLDIQPRSHGHTMVIPKIHAATISELPDRVIQPFFRDVKIVTDGIKKALHPDGFTMGMNYGVAGGQEVEHMHFHIIPRWEGDGGGPIQIVVNQNPKEDLKDLANQIRISMR